MLRCCSWSYPNLKLQICTVHTQEQRREASVSGGGDRRQMSANSNIIIWWRVGPFWTILCADKRGLDHKTISPGGACQTCRTAPAINATTHRTNFSSEWAMVGCGRLSNENICDHTETKGIVVELHIFFHLDYAGSVFEASNLVFPSFSSHTESKGCSNAAQRVHNYPTVTSPIQ